MVLAQGHALLLEGLLQPCQRLRPHAVQLPQIGDRHIRQLPELAVCGPDQRPRCRCADVPGKSDVRRCHVLDPIEAESALATELPSPHWHTSSAVFTVVRGERTLVVEGERLDWAENDRFVLPSSAEHRFANRSRTEPAILACRWARRMIFLLSW